jgi:hypothetical protein
VFPETQLPVYGVPGNSVSGKKRWYEKGLLAESVAATRSYFHPF